MADEDYPPCYVVEKEGTRCGGTVVVYYDYCPVSAKYFTVGGVAGYVLV